MTTHHQVSKHQIKACGMAAGEGHRLKRELICNADTQGKPKARAGERELGRGGTEQTIPIQS